MCGIIGVQAADNRDTLEVLVHGLSFLRSRGQDDCGATLINSKRKILKTERYHKAIGRDFYDILLNASHSLKPRLAIGHTGYRTSSHSRNELRDSANIHPIEVRYNGMTGAGVHNGTIIQPNLYQIQNAIKEPMCDELCSVDTRFLTELLMQEMLSQDTNEKAARRFMNLVDGSYSFMFSEGEEVHVLRDPRGRRPLCLGSVIGRYSKKPVNVAVSESGLFDDLVGKGYEARFLRHVFPGEYLTLSQDLDKEPNVLIDLHYLKCFFEDKYFKDRYSLIEINEREGTPELESAGEYRHRDGADLCEQYHDVARKLDLIVPIKNSGLTFAQGFTGRCKSFNSKVEYKDILEKVKDSITHQVNRNFIQPEGKRTHEFKIDCYAVRGRNIAFVDDSIVRGDTSAAIYNVAKKAGAKEVHFFIACPPVFYHCDHGIDTPTDLELFANSAIADGIITRDEVRAGAYDIGKINDYVTNKLREHVRELFPDINPNDLYVHYQSPENNLKNLPMDKKMYCLECIHGKAA
ncbi:MAG: hypothetical protein KKE20_06335 [Nanoarchaeota archaeon]|nr:hypothetical protein [Nanoarchaeota archaeon]